MEAGGWLVTVAGLVCTFAVLGPRWAATHGSGLTYVVSPPSASVAGWLNVVLFFGPLVGFNLLYFGSPVVRRRKALGGFLAVVGVQLLAVVLGALWMAGAGVPIDLAVSDTSDDGGGVAGAIFLLSVSLVAAAIMLWLGGSSTFDEQSGDYFGTGSATVEVRPIGSRARLLWVGGLLLLAGLLCLPVILAGHRRVGGSGATRPWPAPYDGNGTLAGLTFAFLLLVGAPLGVAVSMLAKSTLYATVWRQRAAESRENAHPTLGQRLLKRGQHVPMALAVIWLLLAVDFAVPAGEAGEEPWSSLWGAAGALVPAAVGVWALGRMWRFQGQRGRPRPMRLRNAAM